MYLPGGYSSIDKFLFAYFFKFSDKPSNIYLLNKKSNVLYVMVMFTSELSNKDNITITNPIVLISASDRSYIYTTGYILQILFCYQNSYVYK